MHDEIIHAIVILHTAATLFMVGLIWFVQIVHYPLMNLVGRSEFVKYEQAHALRTTCIVVLPMLTELATGLIFLWIRPVGISLMQALVGVVLLAIIWCSTQFVQVPCHSRLSRVFDPDIHRRLVRTNWIRTIAWSLRGLLVLSMVVKS